MLLRMYVASYQGLAAWHRIIVHFVRGDCTSNFFTTRPLKRLSGTGL